MKVSKLVAFPLMCFAFIAGCTNDVKSVEYYAAHPEEARKMLAECQSKDVKIQIGDPVCTNPTKGYAIYKNAQNKASTAAAISEIDKMRKDGNK